MFFVVNGRIKAAFFRIKNVISNNSKLWQHRREIIIGNSGKSTGEILNIRLILYGKKQLNILGVTTHANLLAAQGYNLNLYIGAAGSTGKDFKAFSIPEFIDAAGVDRAGEMGIIPILKSYCCYFKLISRNWSQTSS